MRHRGSRPSERPGARSVVRVRPVRGDWSSVARAFASDLGQWPELVASASLHDDAAWHVHGLIRFGAPRRDPDGAVRRHLWLCADPTTVRGNLRCLSQPHLSGQIHLDPDQEGHAALTIVAFTHGPRGWLGRMMSAPETWDATAAAWVERLAEALVGRLERVGGPTERARQRPEIVRMPLPMSVPATH